MKYKQSITSTLVTLLLALTSEAGIIADGGFESPVVPINSNQYNSIGGSWAFLSYSGIINGNGAGFHAPPAQEGTQYAFLQDYFGPSGTISQSITLDATGTYSLSFLVAGRPDNGMGSGGNLSYEILLDTALIGSDVTTTGQPFAERAFSFSASAGSHILTFQPSALQSGDNTAFFETVSINTVPEPAPASLYSIVIITIAVLFRRHNSKRQSTACNS